MRWHKFISTVLHPIVVPTLGALSYFMIIPLTLNKQRQYLILSIIFITTYVIPLLLLIFLKAVNIIKSYRVHSIEERKIPLFFMISLFFILGKIFYNNPIDRDFSYLFYGTSLSLILVYFIFFIRVKTSLHLLSMGSALGFFLIFQQTYGGSILPIIAIIMILSGLLASSRLFLKAHTPKEVYLGFFIGVSCQFLVYWFLQ